MTTTLSVPAAAIVICLGSLSLPVGAWGEETTVIDFDEVEVGSVPESLFVIDGEFTVVEVGEGGNRMLEINPVPLAEAGAIGGPSIKGGGKASATFVAEAARRSYPRFGVGLHGLSGFRLRVVPARDQLELLRYEEPVATVAFEWKPGVATHVEIEVSGEGEIWTVSGSVWQEGSERPEGPQIKHEAAEAPGSGKASVWGTCYAGKPIRIDDFTIVAPAG